MEVPGSSTRLKFAYFFEIRAKILEAETARLTATIACRGPRDLGAMGRGSFR